MEVVVTSSEIMKHALCGVLRGLGSVAARVWCHRACRGHADGLPAACLLAGVLLAVILRVGLHVNLCPSAPRGPVPGGLRRTGQRPRPAASGWQAVSRGPDAKAHAAARLFPSAMPRLGPSASRRNKPPEPSRGGSIASATSCGAPLAGPMNSSKRERLDRHRLLLRARRERERRETRQHGRTLLTDDVGGADQRGERDDGWPLEGGFLEADAICRNSLLSESVFPPTCVPHTLHA
jgi:hypothetical protein